MNESNAAGQEFDVHVSFHCIRYSEGERSLELDRDASGGAHAVIYTPSPARWAVEMPEWARDRREEILQRIRSRCSHLEDEWHED